MLRRGPRIWRFDGFELDEGRRELRRNGAAVGIEPKPRELLILLLQHHPFAVSREEIRGRLWPDVAVTGASLDRAVNALRSALSLARGSRGLVRTIRGYGYGLDVRVEREAAATASVPATERRVAT